MALEEPKGTCSKHVGLHVNIEELCDDWLTADWRHTEFGKWWACDADPGTARAAWNDALKKAAEIAQEADTNYDAVEKIRALMG